MKIIVATVLCIVLAISCDPTKASPARIARQATTDPVDVNSPEFLTCFRNCPSTYEYNPVCARNGVTYDNDGRLRCANRCGANTTKMFNGACAPL